jgi:MYXO-CTERM domain-containing protein
VLTGARADAYVRSRTAHGKAVFWPGACVYIQPDSGGSPDLDPAVVFDTIKKSIANWQTVTTCAYLQIHYDEPAPLEAHLDGKNVVKFRTDKWCHPEDAQNHSVCYDKSAAAITTVFYLDRPGDAQDGFIIDADVELNNINFTFVIEPSTSLPRSGTSVADLENTLTHEFGHLQGLDHTCKDAATPANAVDQDGNPPPLCSMLGSLPTDQRIQITEATMFNSATPGETKKRSPEQDDINGVCSAYPLDQAAKHSTCKHTNLGDYQTTGCGILPHPASGVTAWLLALLAIALVARRRRRA